MANKRLIIEPDGAGGFQLRTFTELAISPKGKKRVEQLGVRPGDQLDIEVKPSAPQGAWLWVLPLEQSSPPALLSTAGVSPREQGGRQHVELNARTRTVTIRRALPAGSGELAYRLVVTPKGVQPAVPPKPQGPSHDFQAGTLNTSRG